MLQEIGIKVGADVTGLTKGVNDANNSIKKLADSFNGVLDGSIAEARANIKSLEAEIINLGNVSRNPIARDLSVQLKSANKELQAMEKNAGLAGNAAGNAFTKAYSGIRQIAYILPGIGVAGILGALSTELISLITQTKELDKATKDYQESLAAVIGGAAEEASRVEVLVTALQSGKLSREQTKGAIQELQRISPDYFSTLKTEKTNVDDITKSYNNYNNALVKSIENQLKTADLTKAVQDRLSAQVQFPAADAFIKQQQAAGKTLNDIVTDNTQKLKQSVADGAKQMQQASDMNLKSLKGVGLALTDNTKKSEDSSKTQIEGLDDVLVALVKEREILGTIDAAKSGIKAPTVKDTTLSDISKEISALEELRRAGVATTLDLEQLFKLKIQKISLELPKSGLSDSQAELLKQSVEGEAEEALRKHNPVVRIPHVKITSDSFDVTQLGKNLQQTDLKLNLPKLSLGEAFLEFGNIKDIGTEAGAALEGFTSKFLKLNGVVAASQFSKNLTEKFKDTLKATTDLANKISNVLKDTIAAGIGQIGVALGDLISGGNIGDAIKGFIDILGNGLVEIGKATIAYAIEIGILKKVIDGLIKSGPYGVVAAIGVGIAAIALGTALKNKVSNTKGFADGGIASGPTSGYTTVLHGNELIVPLDKPSRIAAALSGGGGGQVVVLETRVRGEDIYFSQRNVGKRKNRLG